MLIFYNIFNMYNLTKYHFYLIQSISYVSINIIVWLNRNLILINKIIKHRSKACVAESNIFIYICLLIFPFSSSSVINDFFLLIHIILDLFNYMYV